ncbi:hypothetical protein [Bacillus sp. 1P06AnD]|uniref:hypothetical protein n=1 Tax=Bacillus sp. 1P06AnD TaxID=3132208 RepID=UPI0039A30F6A
MDQFLIDLLHTIVITIVTATITQFITYCFRRLDGKKGKKKTTRKPAKRGRSSKS